MHRKTKIQKECENCKNEFETLEARSRFCCKRCAAQFNGKGRTPSDETKNKIRESVKRFKKENPIQPDQRLMQSILVGEATKGKYNKNPNSIMDLSKRTISKVIKRLDIGCSQCGWNEAICDIHHINGRKGKDPDRHENLTYVCPNCHRKCHTGLLKKDQLINLQQHIGDRWKQFYYG